VVRLRELVGSKETNIVQGQNFSSDALFTPKMDIFKQTILNTVYIKHLKSFYQLGNHYIFKPL